VTNVKAICDECNTNARKGDIDASDGTCDNPRICDKVKATLVRNKGDSSSRDLRKADAWQYLKDNIDAE